MLPCWPEAYNELTGQPTRGKEPAPLDSQQRRGKPGIMHSMSAAYASTRRQDRGRQRQHRLDRGEVRGPLPGCLTQTSRPDRSWSQQPSWGGPVRQHER